MNDSSKRQISESIQLGIVLALAGGFMDAYSYMCRGHVFANAQTGNILLIGINVSTGQWMMALRYLCPVVAFVIGIAAADIVRFRLKEQDTLHWRQITVLFEIVALTAVAFFPQSMNLAANSLTSFACGLQVESFRKINGNGIATTMCIGNLRTATQAVCEYHYSKDKSSAGKGMLFYGIIFVFVVGAILGNFAVNLFMERAILGGAILLTIGFIMMFFEMEESNTTIRSKNVKRG